MNSQPNTFEIREADAWGYRAAEVPPALRMLSEKRREGFMRAYRSIQDKRDRIRAYSALTVLPGPPNPDPAIIPETEPARAGPADGRYRSG